MENSMETMDTDVRCEKKRVMLSFTHSASGSLSLISVSEKSHQQRRRRVQKLRKVEEQ